MVNLFVRPCHEYVVAYLHYYSKELVKSSQLLGFKTFNKEGGKANKKEVTNVIQKMNPLFIMFNGHGDSDSIYGNEDKIIIQLGLNENLLKEKIIYSLSCSSAVGLGKTIADKKTTFIGYIDDFALGTDKNSEAAIYRDKKAKLFLEPSNILVSSLLKGNSVIEAVKKAKDLMKQNISILRTDPFPDAKDYIPYLYNNYLALDFFGNANAKLK